MQNERYQPRGKPRTLSSAASGEVLDPKENKNPNANKPENARSKSCLTEILDVNNIDNHIMAYTTDVQIVEITPNSALLIVNTLTRSTYVPVFIIDPYGIMLLSPSKLYLHIPPVQKTPTPSTLPQWNGSDTPHSSPRRQSNQPARHDPHLRL